MGDQLGFYFEQKYCTGCKTCQIACKDKNDLGPGQNFRTVYEFCGGSFEKENNAYTPHVFAYYVSVSCNHCLDPACMKACPMQAISKREEDGIVLIDRDRCTGCKRCIKSCPYKAVSFDARRKKAVKCDFCLDELKKGKKPVCVSSCPMRVLDCDRLDKLKEKYGTCAETAGTPKSDLTSPAWVITPHRDAVD